MIQSVAGLLRARVSNDKLSLALSNKIDALGHAQAAVREFLDKLGISERRIFETELVFEELFTNTVRHGYADRALHWIEVTLHLTTEAIVMTFDDGAQRFDPTAAELPVLPTTLDEAKIGGLGLTLVHRTARDIHYERVDGRNRLHLSIPRD